MNLIPARYSPTTGQIGCVIMQAAMGGEPAVAKLFSNDDWILDPLPSLVLMRASWPQWQWLASLPKEERAERWNRLQPDYLPSGQFPRSPKKMKKEAR